jgi:exopolyphosphatase / guanosine-5'-triphosphate,3'-diphosphate pyrophosphatase
LRRACIDIGSNTTRLLVAESDGERLLEVHQERSFTRIGQDQRSDGTISPAKLAEVVQVVAEQLQSARDLGAVDVRGVATASIRRAANGNELIGAIARECGLAVKVLSEQEEARLAFVGAARTLGHVPAGDLGVVDVGGGSSEIAVGRAPDQVHWSASFPVGSGEIADTCLRSDPPSQAELGQARLRVSEALAGVIVPRPAEAVAVGGSAASLRRLAGSRLDQEGFRRAFGLLGSERTTDLARRFALDRERVRLLPAGLVILQAVSELLGAALEIGCGGVREGVLLEAPAPPD